MNAIHLAHLAHQIADASVVSDIECHALPTVCGAQRWHDTSHMLDVREHAPEVIDMLQQALAYGEERGLFYRHPIYRHLVRFSKDDQP